MVSIVKILLNRNCSYKKLQELTGVNDATLVRVSHGKRVSLETAKRICEYYKLNIKDVKEFQMLYGKEERSNVAKKTANKRKGNRNSSSIKNKKYKPESCRNRVCPLNKNGKCINDVVLSGRAGCSNKDVPKDNKEKSISKNIVINPKSLNDYIERGKRLNL